MSLSQTFRRSAAKLLVSVGTFAAVMTGAPQTSQADETKEDDGCRIEINIPDESNTCIGIDIIDIEGADFPPHDFNAAYQAFREIASTEEGAALIKKVAAKSPNGNIPFLYNKDGITLSFKPNIVALGSEDSNFRYHSPETGQHHDMSIQRILFHELQHFALGHEVLRGDEDNLGISPSKESEAVRATNTFMKKYYNEPARGEDTASPKNDFSGTKEWDVNPGFKPK